MAKKTSIDLIDKTIESELKLYSSEVVKGMKKVNDECIEEFVRNTKRDAPKGSRKKYYKKIASETILETPNKKTNVWYVKDSEYRLTHLLINGHATKNGGRTKADDFITPNYKKLEQNFENGIKKVIENGYKKMV